MRKIMAVLLVLALCIALPLSAMAAEKKAPCGTEGHFRGDGMDHNRPESCWVKGHRNCDGGDHDWAPCGYRHHFNCDGKYHGPAACGVEGHTDCDYNEHTVPKCGIAGHCVSDDMKHYAASCGIAGHTVCDGQDHTRAACGVKGHRVCDGLEHTAPECGLYRHCVNDGKEHIPAACGVEGHYACDGGKHIPAACGIEGHFACVNHDRRIQPISKYCNAEPQHLICEGDPEHFCDPEKGGCGETYLCSDSNKHTTCVMCGLLWCDDSLGSHYAPCGNAKHRQCVYRLNGKVWRASDHPVCHLCGGGKCSGRHGLGACVDVCDQCGEALVDVGTHRGACDMHFVCISSGKHSWCSKHNVYKCDDKCDCK